MPLANKTNSKIHMFEIEENRNSINLNSNPYYTKENFHHVYTFPFIFYNKRLVVFFYFLYYMH